jgi:hypothetical protein
MWDKAENALMEALNNSGRPWALNPGVWRMRGCPLPACSCLTLTAAPVLDDNSCFLCLGLCAAFMQLPCYNVRIPWVTKSILVRLTHTHTIQLLT